jgi:hypothetical protein
VVFVGPKDNSYWVAIGLFSLMMTGSGARQFALM